jgi:TPR repeat protein
MLMLNRFPSIAVYLFVTLASYSTGALSTVEFTLGYEAAQSGDYKRAISMWKPLAEKGDPAAQYTLGWMFESGQGVSQSYKQAAYWYTKAANQGDVAAQFVLGSMYQKGNGVPLDNTQAAKWFIKAANQGDAIAQYRLGVFFQNGQGVKQNYEESLAWFTKAAIQGHITSQINLGKIYQLGRGTSQNFKEAIKWYEEAANQNNALGYYHLAHMYEYGRGVPQDLQKAKSLYLKSANNNYTPSAYKIAEFYELGKGLEIDYKNAIKWYKESAQKGNSGAQFKLGNLYREGKGVQQNIRTAIGWYNQAATQNHAQAHYELGDIYDNGNTSEHASETIKVNDKKAFRHFQQAVELNFPYAYARLASLYEKGKGIEKDPIKAIELYKKATQPWAKDRYQSLKQRLQCFETATTKLFTIDIACTTREILREKIKENDIKVIDENLNNWSDTYFTGAAIPGSSQLQVTYTRQDFFVSAQYIFVGRNNPALISQVKNKLAEKYGDQQIQSGDVTSGPVSFKWILADGIHLTVSRDWPDTTTYVLYSSPEKQAILDAQQIESSDKYFNPADMIPEKEKSHSRLF